MIFCKTSILVIENTVKTLNNRQMLCITVTKKLNEENE